MDRNGNMNSINLMNFGTVEPPNSTLRSQFGLQLRTPMADKPHLGGAGGFRGTPSVMTAANGGPFNPHHIGVISESEIPMDYWNRERARYFNALSVNQHHGYYQPNYEVTPVILPPARVIQMPQQISLPKNENVGRQKEEVHEEISNGSVGAGGTDGLVAKKRGGVVPKSPPKEKKPNTRAPRASKDERTPSANRAIRPPKKRAEVVINGINMDISGIPIPICSCTGTPQQCYRWGQGGWQSACCTTNLSTYPLPMSTKRRGARIAGRKMSIGAFKKVLEKLASEGYNFTDPIDLRNYWAKHGTNKFVTIR